MRFCLNSKSNNITAVSLTFKKQKNIGQWVVVQNRVERKHYIPGVHMPTLLHMQSQASSERMSKKKAS